LNQYGSARVEGDIAPDRMKEFRLHEHVLEGREGDISSIASRERGKARDKESERLVGGIFPIAHNQRSSSRAFLWPQVRTSRRPKRELGQEKTEGTIDREHRVDGFTAEESTSKPGEAVIGKKEEGGDSFY